MDTILFNVAGIMHRPKKIIKMVADEIGGGDVLELEREPDNKYDPDAVKVFYEEEWIGYVEREFSQEVSELIDSGVDYDCKVFDCTPEWDFDDNDKEVVTDIDLLVEITIK